MEIELSHLTHWWPNAGMAVGGFLVCLIGFPITIQLSKLVGLVDIPSERKLHKGSTPLVGGITVYFALILVSALLAREWINVSMLLWIGAVMAVGVVDDLSELSALNRVIAHSAIIAGIFFTDGLAIYSIGSPLGTGPITFTTPLALCFTGVAVLGAINSVNMIDGVDGLLGSLAIVSLVTILMIASTATLDGFIARSFTITEICIVLGSLCAFLLLNSRFFSLKKAIVFLGDAGSTAIGFCIVYLLIDYSQGKNPAISPVTAGWILGVPLLDASAVIGQRLLSGRSPIRPGRDHIHHILLDSGVTVNRTVAALVLLHCIIVFTGVAAPTIFGQHSDFLLFWSFLGMVVARIIFTDTLTYYLKTQKQVDRNDTNTQTSGIQQG